MEPMLYLPTRPGLPHLHIPVGLLLLDCSILVHQLNPAGLLTLLSLGCLLSLPSSVHLCIHTGLAHLPARLDLSPPRRMVTLSHFVKCSSHCGSPGSSASQYSSSCHRMSQTYSHALIDPPACGLLLIGNHSCSSICSSLSHHCFPKDRAGRVKSFHQSHVSATRSQLELRHLQGDYGSSRQLDSSQSVSRTPSQVRSLRSPLQAHDRTSSCSSSRREDSPMDDQQKDEICLLGPPLDESLNF